MSRAAQLQSVADKLQGMREDAETALAFAEQRRAYAELEHYEGRAGAITAFVEALGATEMSGDPIGTALTEVRRLMDQAAAALPTAEARNLLEGRLSVLGEIALMLIRLRTP